MRSGRFFHFFRREEVLQRKSAIFPGFQPPEQRTDARDPHLFQLQRYPSAGGFARSSAIENDVAFARNQFLMLFDLFWIEM